MRNLKIYVEKRVIYYFNVEAAKWIFFLRKGSWTCISTRLPTLLSVLVKIKGMSTNDQGVDTSSVWNLLEVCFSNMWLKSTGNVLF